MGTEGEQECNPDQLRFRENRDEKGVIVLSTCEIAGMNGQETQTHKSSASPALNRQKPKMVENGGPLSLRLACPCSLNSAIIGAPLGSCTHKHRDPRAHARAHTPDPDPSVLPPKMSRLLIRSQAERSYQWQEKKLRDWTEAFTLKEKWIALTPPILIVLGRISKISERSANNRDSTHILLSFFNSH